MIFVYRTLNPAQTDPVYRPFPHIVQTRIVAVGDDCLALLLELRQVVDHAAAKERRPEMCIRDSP